MTSPDTNFATLNRQEWRDHLMRLGDEKGFFKELGEEHTALHVRAGSTLVVTFENLDHVYEHDGSRLPWGYDFTQSHNWSILGLMAHDWTWYRDEAVFDFFDDLRDDGFFELFERVIFYGASMGAYAAAVFSASCPGANVILISPQATLDRAIVPWETRYSKAWDRDYRHRYGYAPEMLKAADKVYLFFDPFEELDSSHAELFDGQNTHKLHCRLLGHRIASALQGMGVLKPIVQKAVSGELTEVSFYNALRARRVFPRYCKEMLARLEKRGNPFLTALFCEHYLATRRGPLFRKALNQSLATLKTQGRAPPSQVFQSR